MLAVVTDPYDASTGEELPKLRADVVTVTRDDPAHNNVGAVVAGQRGDVRVVRGPGEYEMGGVFITGVAMKADGKKGAEVQRGTVYTFNFDGLTVVHLGGLSFVPSQAQVEALERGVYHGLYRALGHAGVMLEFHRTDGTGPSTGHVCGRDGKGGPEALKC